MLAVLKGIRFMYWPDESSSPRLRYSTLKMAVSDCLI